MGITVGTGIRVSPRSTISLRGLVAQYETNIDSDAYGAHLEWGTDIIQRTHAFTFVRERSKPS